MEAIFSFAQKATQSVAGYMHQLGPSEKQYFQQLEDSEEEIRGKLASQFEIDV